MRLLGDIDVGPILALVSTRVVVVGVIVVGVVDVDDADDGVVVIV